MMDSSLDVIIYENVLTSPTEVLETLEQEIQYLPADECKVRVRGKQQRIPRQIAAYGEDGLAYTFSSLTVTCKPWTPLLLEIKKVVENLTDTCYNFVLVNRYKDGTCSIGQHKDNELDLDENEPIASLSLGESRTMVFKRPQYADHRIELKSNSLLVMKPPTNDYWSHGIPPQKERCGIRINLSFRVLKRRENSVNKRKSDEEDTLPGREKKKTSGAFSSTDIPEHMVHLGDNVFVFPSLFRDQTSVHIRRFQLYGSKLYATKDGVNFPPEFLIECFTLCKTGGEDYKIERGNKCFVLSNEQWNDLQKQRRSILLKTLTFVFNNIDFIRCYEIYNEGPIPSSLPLSFDVALGTSHVLEMFKDALKYTLLCEDNLKEPKTMAEELWANDPLTFYSAALSIDADLICSNFYAQLKDSEPHLFLHPKMYVTREFFHTLPIGSMLKELFENLCPSNTFEYYQDSLNV